MQVLKCKACGGSLVMDSTSESAVCEYCGLKYTTDSLQQMIKSLSDVELKVEGIENLDAMLSRAATYQFLGEVTKAEQVLQEVTRKYPGDYRGWWELAKLKYFNHEIVIVDELSSSKEFQHALALAPEREKSTLINAQLLYSQPIQEVRAVTENHFQNILSKEYSILEDKLWVCGEFYSEIYFSIEGQLYVMFRIDRSYDEYCFGWTSLEINGGRKSMVTMSFWKKDKNSTNPPYAIFNHTILKFSSEQMVIIASFNDRTAIDCKAPFIPGHLIIGENDNYVNSVRVLTPIALSSADPRIISKLNELKTLEHRISEEAKEEAKQEAARCARNEVWRKSGVCAYCGNNFNRNGYCKVCKRARNY